MTPCWPQPPGHGCEGGAESICESKDPEELRPKCESRVKPLTPQVLEVMEKKRSLTDWQAGCLQGGPRVLLQLIGLKC